MKVPLLELNPQNLPLEAELKQAFNRVLHSGQFILGPELEKFEKNCALTMGTRHAIGVSSGTDAILLALMALDIGPGDEVLCPAFTFFATAGCVSRVGATPVFVDVCPVCFNIDPADAERKITPKTRAVIPVHLFGQCAEMDTLLALARRHGLRVIEDCAQSMGATYRGRPAGSMGDFGITSFFPSKNLGGFGDSGLLVTQDDALAEKARTLRMHGMNPKYFHRWIGGNFRMDPLQAALLSVKLPHLPTYHQRRRQHAARYQQELAQRPGVHQARPEDCACLATAARQATEGIRLVLPTAYPHNEHIWNQFTLRVPSTDGTSTRRDHLLKFLQRHEIGCDIYYPVPLHQQECYRHLPSVSLPVCERLAREVLSIPVYPDLRPEMQAHVLHILNLWLEGKSG
jgi:dTDP-4-amino-4,6-dideoxygalactose transaminase